MVLSGEGHERPRARKNLHNFTFSSWGVQHIMKCMKKVDGGSSAAAVDQPLQRKPSTSKLDNETNGRLRSEEDGSREVGLEEFRERIMSELKTVRQAILREQALDYEEEDESEQRKEMEQEVSPPQVEVKTWNLRKRREACNAPPVMESGNCDANMSVGSKFIATLSKKEVEDDLVMMMGHRPTRRPRKRSRTLQKKINLLQPAFYFSEDITEDLY